MYKYEVIIYWSDEDGAFVAEVPELPGCAAHGDAPDGRWPTAKRRSGFGSTRPWSSAGRFLNRRGAVCSLPERRRRPLPGLSASPPPPRVQDFKGR